jgi:SAM-dependent methyltransferase
MRTDQHMPDQLVKADYASEYRDASKIAGSLAQASYRRQARKLLERLGNLAEVRVLDLGCGTGFLKPLFAEKAAHYQGIDGDARSIGIARQLYRPEGFIHGYFPQDLVAAKFDLIISLSCVDEMPDRAMALAAIADRLAPGGRSLLAVRNGTFPVHRLKRFLHRVSMKKTLVVDDLDYDNWVATIRQAGLNIEAIEAYHRPWFIGVSANGLKNTIYRAANWALPKHRCYMLQFLLSKK